jgi:hypothetical protein
MTENTTKDTPVAVPVTALPSSGKEDMAPTLTREYIIGELAARYVTPGGKIAVARAIKENPGWGAVLGGTGHGNRHVVSAEARRHTGYRPQVKGLVAADVAARSRQAGQHGVPTAPAYFENADVKRVIKEMTPENRYVIQTRRRFQPKLISPLPYSDGVPYCPHCGGFTQPWNRAFNAARAARAEMGKIAPGTADGNREEGSSNANEK